MSRLSAIYQRALLVLVLFLSACHDCRAQVDADPVPVADVFMLLLLGPPEGRTEAREYIESQWQPGFVPMVLEVITLNQDPALGSELVSLLEKKTGQSFGFDIGRWQRWLWAQESRPHPQYASFKSALYGLIDPHFETYFNDDRLINIRLDEVLWGGVKQDGIPPLRNPKMITATQADYLDDENIVFALEVNGDARAYPKRILAWHEMFVDEVGGLPVAGVYCTLCGTMILYNTQHDGVNHQLGTSGFLYRSNKLMYDKATQSLWNTIWGKPVVGPLTNQDISLEQMSVVTTTWGEWRRRHPKTLVLSLDTGHSRDYGEGVAYQDYFATDQLMFQVPVQDRRLNNKDEVLALVFPQYPDQPLAIAASYLKKHGIYQDTVGDISFVVFTDSSGANRVYQAQALKFTDWDGDSTIEDTSGTKWQLSEAQLLASDGRILHRLPAHRAFWFGWFSAYSHTRLIQ